MDVTNGAAYWISTVFMSPLESAWWLLTWPIWLIAMPGSRPLNEALMFLMESAQPRPSHIRRPVCKSNILKAPHKYHGLHILAGCFSQDLAGNRNQRSRAGYFLRLSRKMRCLREIGAQITNVSCFRVIPILFQLLQAEGFKPMTCDP